MGRPTKLDDHLILKIANEVHAGNREVVAAGMANVPERTYYLWKRRGIESIEKDTAAKECVYRRLVEAVQESAASAEARMIGIVSLAARKSWQAAAWWLERTRPHQYGLRPRQQNYEEEGPQSGVRSALRTLMDRISRGELEKGNGTQPA